MNDVSADAAGEHTHEQPAAQQEGLGDDPGWQAEFTEQPETLQGDKPPVDEAAKLLGDRDFAAQVLPGGGAIRWEELTGEERISAWCELRKFVDWWSVRYRVSEKLLPVCWYRHPAIVEELTALQTARRASLSSADQGLGSIGWHERAELLRGRLEHTHYRGECATGHIEPAPRKQVSEDEWGAWLESEKTVVAAPLTDLDGEE